MQRRGLVIGGVVVLVVAVVAAIAVIASGDSDGGGISISTPATANSTTVVTGSTVSPIDGTTPSSTVEGDAPTTPPTTDATDPGSAPTSAAPGTTPGPDGSNNPAYPCQVSSSSLLDLVRADPLLADYAADLQIADVRCSGTWASGIISAPETDSALALFEQKAGAYVLLTFGSSDPCAGQGIAGTSEAALGCRDWP